jgi:AcrR family transcriptional regulator
MGTMTRKQREIEERERKLLGVAREMLIEHGYAGLGMDRLAEMTEYSKGTIYQHFSSKEDLVAALLIESCGQRLELFERARQFQGRTRERMLAFAIADNLFARLQPHHFRSEQVIRWADLDARASEKRRETLLEQDRCIIRWVMEIVEIAVAGKDLVLERGQSVGGVVFSLYSMVIGSHWAMLNFPHLLKEMRVSEPFESLRDNMQTMLDGLRWRPLRGEWDYDQTFQRVCQEIFPHESRDAGFAGG